MNKDIKTLIEDVANNNLSYAKQDIRNLLEKNKSASDEEFCRRISNKLDTSFVNQPLPYYVEKLLTLEDCSNFNTNRYLLTDREKKLFDSIVQAKKVNSRLTDMGIRYVNSTLLYGESGTGKTTFGKYLSHELGLPFCYINFSKTIAGLMGKTAENIDDVFHYVLQEKDIVLMLDEVDAIGCKRGNQEEGSLSGEMNRVVITLMQCLDKVDNDTIILGGTNRLDMIDSALARRFTFKHEVQELKDNESEQLIRKFLTDTGIEFTDDDVNDLALCSSNKQNDVVNSCIEYIIDKLVEEDENDQSKS